MAIADTNSPQGLPELLARLLRHEVGDLLQTIYASVAILQERLPPEMTLERRVLSDLRSRGDICKGILDAIHDYVCPVTLNVETVDPGDLPKQLVASLATQFPRLDVKADVDPRTPKIQADARRVAQVANLLLSNACHAAQKRVVFAARPGPDSAVEWTVTDDGPGIAEEQRPRLFTLSTATRHGHLGVGPALARKIVLQHGGQISADNLPGGGFQMRVVLPGRPREM